MATRYSGNATIRARFVDQENAYACRVAVGGRCVWRGLVYGPAAGFGPGIAYDSPEAYDSTAHAALSFAMGESAHIEPESKADGSGWEIRRSPMRMCDSCMKPRPDVQRRPLMGNLCGPCHDREVRG